MRDYLRMNVTLADLRVLCDILDVDYKKHHNEEALCDLLRRKRPDLMRGRVWNFLRFYFSSFDIQTEYGLYFLKNILLNPVYKAAEMVSYLFGNTDYGVGYGKYALQRHDARIFLGQDPRKNNRYKSRRKL